MRALRRIGCCSEGGGPVYRPLLDGTAIVSPLFVGVWPYSDRSPGVEFVEGQLATAIPGAQYYGAAKAGHGAQSAPSNEHDRIVLRCFGDDAAFEVGPKAGEAAVRVSLQ